MGLDWILKLANLGRVTRWRLALALHGGHMGRRCAIAPGVRLECGRGQPIVLGDGVRLLRGVVLSTRPGGRITLESHVYVGEYGIVRSAAEICIARDTIIAPHVHIEDFDAANTNLEGGPLAADPVRIGRDVWFGAGVTVLRGVRIGDQAVLGAGAVADQSVPDRGVAVGVPARVFRFRGEPRGEGKRPE